MSIELPDGATEEETARDGAFSYATEWHAFTLGVAIGVAMIIPSRRLNQFVWYAVGFETIDEKTRSDALRQVRQESWYALGGVVCGVQLGLLCVVVTLAAAVP